MRPQSAKAKGRRLQQETRDALLARFPGLKPDDIRNTPMGTQGEDLLFSPAAREVIPFSPECGNQERINIWEKIDQASKHAHPPMVVFRKNGRKAMVALPFESLLDLLVAAAEGTWQVGTQR